MDIDSLRKEIDGRKKHLDERKSILGEKTNKKQNKDQFLRELLHSSRTGQETDASVKVKTVDRVAESKITGKPIDPNILQHAATSSNTNERTTNVQPQRTAAMDARMEEAKRLRELANIPNTNNFKTSNTGMADAMEQYMNIPKVGAPMNNNSGMLTEAQMIENYKKSIGVSSAPNTLINEQVTNVARELLNENFGKLYAEAMKNSIIETYKAEVIKEAIRDNRSVIEQIVRETIIDLQKKAQSRK